ncbi:MAG TPA: hypothetical protein VK015_00915 [Microbacterium sp.]|nr:hypothetical protein [Microbacterium sp.]
MNPLAVVGSVIGLGVAGLDPVGALMVIPAIAAGARRRVVMAFFLTSAVVTVATGLILGESVQLLTRWLADLTIPDPVRLLAQLVAAAALGWWAVHRFNHRNDPEDDKKKSALGGAVGMTLLGAFWGVSAVTDPSFLALAAIDSQIDSVLASVAVYVGWFVVSQAPLCVVVLTLAAGRNSAPVQRAIAFARRLAKPTDAILTALLALAALLLVLNAATLAVAGAFWPI